MGGEFLMIFNQRCDLGLPPYDAKTTLGSYYGRRTIYVSLLCGFCAALVRLLRGFGGALTH
jgi:hypothetical protein